MKVVSETNPLGPVDAPARLNEAKPESLIGAMRRSAERYFNSRADDTNRIHVCAHCGVVHGIHCTVIQS